jgi:hypothetical protein
LRRRKGLKWKSASYNVGSEGGMGKLGVESVVAWETSTLRRLQL